MLEACFSTDILSQIQLELCQFIPWLNLAVPVNITDPLLSINVVNIFVHALQPFPNSVTTTVAISVELSLTEAVSKKCTHFVNMYSPS